MKDVKNRSVLDRLLLRAGQGLSLRQARAASRSLLIEALENRVLLGGDPPGLADPLVGDPLPAFDGAGLATVNETIGSVGDDDVYRFTAPGNDFVAVLADTTTTGSALDSRVEVYVVDPLQPFGRRLVAEGSTNGVLASTAPLPARDGWTGFISTAGTQYFVRVVGENGTAGAYQLRVDAVTQGIAIAVPTGEPTTVPVAGSISVTQGETIFRITNPNLAAFESIATVVANSDSNDLDTHLEVYDAAGALIASDIESAYLRQAFIAWKASPDGTYYVRVRSDQISGSNQLSTGNFDLLIDTRAEELDQPVSPITRRGLDETRTMGHLNDTDTFVFQAQGTGVTFITVQDFQTGNDVAVRLFDSSGALLAFDDDFVGSNPQIELELVGGEIYFVVVSAFDLANGPLPLNPAPYGLYIEAHSTNDPTSGIDDHVDAGTLPGELSAAQRDSLIRQFDLATPLIWGAPRLFTADGNPAHTNGNSVLDRSWVVDAVGTGRIYQPNDSDLFSFVPQVDMLGEYVGDNDDAGTGLFIGGNLTTGDPDGLFPVGSNSLTVWDAMDYWTIGSQAAPFGFSNNTGTPATPNPEVYALLRFDIDDAGPSLPRLIVGGDFNLTIPGPFGPVTLTNLAQWVFNPLAGKYVWASLGNPNGPVRAMTFYDPASFDPDGSGQTPDNPPIEDPGDPSLVVGGDFTTIGGGAASRIALTENGVAWQALGVGVNGPVHALTVYDPVDPGERREATVGPPALPLVEDVVDLPASLIVGGAFTTAGGVARSNIALWSGIDWRGLGSVVAQNLPVENGNINGTVRSLAVFDPPDTDGGGPAPDLEPLLVIGGSFTTAGGLGASNIATWGTPKPDTIPAGDPEAVGYDPGLLFAPIGAGANGAVRAMTVWDPADRVGFDDPILAIGGDFTVFMGAPAGFVAGWDGTTGPGSAPVVLGIGMDAPVRALAVLTDDDELGIPLIGDGDPQQVLYAGGDFLNADGFPAAHVAQFAFDPNPFINAFIWTALDSGVDGPVFALAQFDDQDPAIDNSENFWDRNDRPSARVAITVSPTDGSFLNAAIRVYDSNFKLVYPQSAQAPFHVDPAAANGVDPLPFNTTISPIAPDPAGSVDPSAAPGSIDAINNLQVWGGETYYIEVISATGGFRNTGRYNVAITTQGVPPDLDGDTVPDDTISAYFEEPDAGQWANAGKVTVDDNAIGNGDIKGNTIQNQGPIPFPVSGSDTRIFDFTPSSFQNSQAGDLGRIDVIDDTDLYYFRANADGFAEIRINTSHLADEFIDRVVDFNQAPPTGIDTPKQRNVDDDEAIVDLADPYQSKLDSVLRIFNNDNELIAISDTNPAVRGAFGNYFVGDAEARYWQRDGRLVIPVIQGEKYYIQVESAQNAVLLQDPTRVDWRRTTGSYMVFVQAMPDFEPDGDDDHAFFPSSTIPIGTTDPLRPGDPANGTGFATGRIDNTLANPQDTDSFQFIAPTSGTVTLTFSATDFGSTLSLGIDITNDGGANIAAGSTGAGGSTAISFLGVKGVTYFIDLEGLSSSEGGYRIDVSLPPFVDDYADAGKWLDAEVVTISGFFGSGSAAGTLEAPGDTDAFIFTAPDWNTARVTVDSTSLSLDPLVLVYEFNEDGVGNIQLYLIGFNNDGANIGTDSRVNFSTTPGRSYIVVVEGFNSFTDSGNYNLVIDQVTPTDDHPNLTDLPTSSVIPITFDPVNGTGAGNGAGDVEITGDTDLFSFSAPASGNGVVTITTADNTQAPRVEVYNAGGTLLASADGAAGAVSVNLTGLLVLGQQYFVSVSLLAGATGDYTVAVTTTPVDDHVNFPTFTDSATNIILAPNNGVGTGAGVVLPSTDTDVFRFNTLATGAALIQLTTPISTFNGQIAVYNASGVLVSTAQGDADTASLTVSASVAGERFYIVVSTDPAAGGSAVSGAYTLRVTGSLSGGGGGGGGPGPDDHVNAGDWNNASAILASSITGDGSRTGIISYLGDSDLFTFTTPAAGAVQVQVNTPFGANLDASLRIFDALHNEVIFDSVGIPGATAAASFNATGIAQYFMLVEQVGSNVGSYTIRVDSEPATHFLYYPEGFSSSGGTIDEFIPMVNPNSEPVQYTVIARYEVGARDQIIATGTIEPNSRGGITVSTRNGDTLVRQDEPYALEIQSTGQLGATLSHYDFGVTTGESFTGRASNTWTFSEAHRDSATFRDFLIFYNTSGINANYTVDLYFEDGSVETFTGTVEALRRSGVSFNDDSRVTRNGRFGVRITADQPIVAALSSYDLPGSRGYGLLGNPDGGATVGVIPSVSTGSGVDSSLSVLNTTGQPASVTFRASYDRVDLPDLVRVITVAAHSRASMTLGDLGLVDSQNAGVRFTSSVPVTVTAVEYQSGDGNATAAGTEAFRTGIIGDAFVNPAVAGITYIENLAFYNPSQVDVNITITFLFTDQTTASRTINLAADDFSLVSIDQDPAIINRVDPTAFSIRIDAPTPIIAAFTHYDLFLNGGWGAQAAPIGLTNPLSSIS